MATLTWLESLPSDGSLVGRSPPEIRQHIASVAEGIGEWLEWPGSGAGSELSAGHLKAGASRPYFAAASAASNPGPQFLFLASDTSRLYFYTSQSSFLAGTPLLIESWLAPTVDAVWTTQSGSAAAVFPLTVTFPKSYTSFPTVIAMSDTSTFQYAISSVSTAGFTMEANGGGSTVTWVALGYASATL